MKVHTPMIDYDIDFTDEEREILETCEQTIFNIMATMRKFNCEILTQKGDCTLVDISLEELDLVLNTIHDIQLTNMIC